MMLRQRLVERLARPPRRQVRGDFDLDPALVRRASLREAAVLVPIVACHAQASVLLTRRSDHLPEHPGQVSFPGGTAAPGDPDAVATALREAREEIGLEPHHVEIAGRLSTYETATGFRIAPVVGLVDPGFIPTPDPEEVAEVFEVPLDFILDPANHLRHTRDWYGRRRRFYAMPYGGFYIWGATAHMLVDLAQTLGDALDEEAVR